MGVSLYIAGNFEAFSSTKIVPILTLSSIREAIDICRILYDAGLYVQEITLRTPNSIEILKHVRSELPHITIGAGTVLDSKMGYAAISAGAMFLVSPGITEDLLKFGSECSAPFLPGVSTASEIMELKLRGGTVAKLFPAKQLGGTAYLNALIAPFPTMKFLATGGIEAGDVPEYLAQANVIAVGGSWMVPERLIMRNDIDLIKSLARAAVAIRPAQLQGIVRSK